jgi:hypothetical protein
MPPLVPGGTCFRNNVVISLGLDVANIPTVQYIQYVKSKGKAINQKVKQ